MKYRIYLLFTVFIFLFTTTYSQNFSLESLLQSDTSWVVDSVISNKEKFRLQIIYTKIERTSNGYPVLTKYNYNVNPTNYFYPASLAKLPMAVIALDKLNSLGVAGVNIFNPLRTSSPYAPPKILPESDSIHTSYMSLASHILRTFILSDNQSPNYLYEFTGHQYLNKRLKELGFSRSVINQRFASGNAETIRTTHPVELLDQNGELLFSQPYTRSELPIVEVSAQTAIGKAHFVGNKLHRKPLDFKYDNYLPLEELDKMMTSIIFPELNVTQTHLNLNVQDYQFLKHASSCLPNSCYYPDYGPESNYPDNYRKFIMFGDLKTPIPNYCVICNKVGLAYGFISDLAYIKDNLHQVEFMLSAVLYVNEDEILNDGIYQYDSIGLPFLGRIGRLIYDYECWMKQFRINK